MKKISKYVEVPKLVVLTLRDEFVNKVNQSSKIKLSNKIILVGEDDEYVYFLDLLNDSILNKSTKVTIIKLENEPYIIDKHVDLEWIYRTKLETLIKNLEYYENTDTLRYQSLNYDNQINILRNLIKNLDSQSKNLPKVVNIIKRMNEQTKQLT